MEKKIRVKTIEYTGGQVYSGQYLFRLQFFTSRTHGAMCAHAKDEGSGSAILSTTFSSLLTLS